MSSLKDKIISEMMKEDKLDELIVEEAWFVNSTQGAIYLGKKDGKVWLAGSPSLLYVPIFKDKAEALKFRKRASKLEKGLQKKY